MNLNPPVCYIQSKQLFPLEAIQCGFFDCFYAFLGNLSNCIINDLPRLILATVGQGPVQNGKLNTLGDSETQVSTFEIVTFIQQIHVLWQKLALNLVNKTAFFCFFVVNAQFEAPTHSLCCQCSLIKIVIWDSSSLYFFSNQTESLSSTHFLPRHFKQCMPIELLCGKCKMFQS